MNKYSMTPPNDSLLSCRAAFEKWFADGFSGETEIVEDEVTQGMWQAWQAAWSHPSASQAAMVEELMKYRQVLCDCDDKQICTPHEIVDGCLEIVTKHTQPQGGEQ